MGRYTLSSNSSHMQVPLGIYLKGEQSYQEFIEVCTVNFHMHQPHV